MPRYHENLVRFKEKDPNNFNFKLMKIWIAHFEHIKGRILSYCEMKDYELTSITMTVPNWANDERVDHIYSGIIQGVFDGHVCASQFFDVSEAQAMARSLVKEQLSHENSELAKLVGQRNMLLVVDIGGTAMLALGCFGGSELWEMAVAEALRKHDPRASDDNVLGSYLSDFADIKAMVQSPDATIRLNHQGDATELIPREARRCFDKAFKRALDDLESRLRPIVARLAKLVERGEGGSYPGRKMGKGNRFEKIALKVVCDRLHGKRRGTDEMLSYLNCYDVFVVDNEETQTPGSYRWYLSVWGRSGRDQACGLTLTIEHVQGEWKDGAEQSGARKEWRIPLRYDIGTGCALPDEANIEQGEWELFYT
ncbi:hypothetical protein RB601_002818 [Gaeumannomyces tritici]